MKIGSRRGCGETAFPHAPLPGVAWPSRRDRGKPGFPTHPPRRGMGKPGFPIPHPREGLGGLRLPRNNRMFIAALCGAAAWTANVNIGCSPTRMRRRSPPPNLPPLGGGAGLPPPSGGRAGEGGRHLRCNGLPLEQGAWGNRVSPCPHPREGLEGLRPPKNKLMFIAALCGAAAWTADR